MCLGRALALEKEGQSWTPVPVLGWSASKTEEIQSVHYYFLAMPDPSTCYLCELGFTDKQNTCQGKLYIKSHAQIQFA